MTLKHAAVRADPCCMTRLQSGDRGDVVLGWLLKIGLVLSVLGVIGFDAINVGMARFGVESNAQNAAREAAVALRDSRRIDTRSIQKAFDAAVVEAAKHGDTVEAGSFLVAPDGTVTLTLTRTASTLVAQRIGPLEDLTRQTVTVTQQLPS